MKLYLILFIGTLSNFAFSESLQFGATMKDFRIDYGINRKLNSTLFYPKLADITFTSTRYCGDGDVASYLASHPDEDYGKDREKIDYVLGYFLVKSDPSGTFPDPNIKDVFTIENWYAVGYGSDLDVRGGLSTKLVPIDHALTDTEYKNLGTSNSLFTLENMKSSTSTIKASALLKNDLSNISSLLDSADTTSTTNIKYRIYPVAMACFDLVKNAKASHQIQSQRYSLAKIGKSLHTYLNTLKNETTYNTSFPLTTKQPNSLDEPFKLESHATKPNLENGPDTLLDQWAYLKSNLNYSTTEELSANINTAKIKLISSVDLLITEKNQCKDYEDNLKNKLWNQQIPQYYLCKYFNDKNLITFKSDINAMDTSTLLLSFTSKKIEVIKVLAIVFNLKRALKFADELTKKYENRNELACFYDTTKNKGYDYYIQKVISSQGFTLKDGTDKVALYGTISHPEPLYAIQDNGSYRVPFMGNLKTLFMGGYPAAGQPSLTPGGSHSFDLKSEAIVIDFHVQELCKEPKNGDANNC